MDNMHSLQGHTKITQAKLTEAKPNIKLFGLDYDGTLTDGENFKKDDAIALIKNILKKDKIPAFITARAATAVKTFVPPLEEHYRQNPDSTSTYIGGGNGTVLYKVNAKGVEKIYSHGLALEEIKFIVSNWESYAKGNLPVSDLSEKGLITFKKFYTDTWGGLIPEEVLAVGRPFDGRIFTEEAKVTFVLPKDVSSHQTVVEEVQKLVGKDFSVAAGDKDFCHITKSLREDSKVVAIKTILERLRLNENQVATFGDMPHGNDKGLLSFPYSFTNNSEIASEKNLEDPPYILPEEGLPPVARVYKAVYYLIQ